MDKFYNYDTRGTPQSSQMIWMENRIRELEVELADVKSCHLTAERELIDAESKLDRLREENARLRSELEEMKLKWKYSVQPIWDGPDSIDPPGES